jgi:hypothetical protein
MVLPPRVVSKAKFSFSSMARSKSRLPSFHAALFASVSEDPDLADKIRRGGLVGVEKLSTSLQECRTGDTALARTVCTG